MDQKPIFWALIASMELLLILIFCFDFKDVTKGNELMVTKVHNFFFMKYCCSTRDCYFIVNDIPNVLIEKFFSVLVPVEMWTNEFMTVSCFYIYFILQVLK